MENLKPTLLTGDPGEALSDDSEPKPRTLMGPWCRKPLLGQVTSETNTQGVKGGLVKR